MTCSGSGCMNLGVFSLVFLVDEALGVFMVMVSEIDEG